MIRTLYFICIIFLKKYNYILGLIFTVNHKASYFPFFLSSSCGPSKFCNHLKHSANKKYLCTTLQLMFWFVKTVHYYSAGPESKIGLSYVSVVCVYGGRGSGGRGFKMFCKRGQNFFYLLCMCVCVDGGQVQYLSFREKNNRPPPPINK